MTMQKKPLIAVAAGAMLLAATAFAMNHGEHSMQHQPVQHVFKNRAVNGYERANRVMHRDMDIRYSGDADVDFARGMIPHHQGAVDMANVQLRFGRDEELKDLSRRIITWQKAEIGEMRAWLNGHDSNWRAENAQALASVKGYMAAMEAMHTAHHPYTGDADYDFVTGMIPHHQAAIDMAWVLKSYGKSPLLRNMADDIIRSQGQEIRWMQDWLEKHPKPQYHKKKHKKHHRKHHYQHQIEQKIHGHLPD